MRASSIRNMVAVGSREEEGRRPIPRGLLLVLLSTIFTCLCSLALTLGFGINFSYFRGSYRNNLFITELILLLVSFFAASQDLCILLAASATSEGRRHCGSICSVALVSWGLSGGLHFLSGLSIVAQLSQTCYFTSFCTLKLIGGVLQMALGLGYGLKVFFARRTPLNE